MNNKYLYQEQISEFPLGYKDIENISIDITKEQKMISGYKCKRAILRFNDADKTEKECFIICC